MTETNLPIAGVDVGDVVQLAPDASDWAACCFAIVTEVKSWGVQAYVFIPQKRGEVAGRAFIRVPKDKFFRIGKAEWTVDDESSL
jgi:hypothetical protein